MQANFARALPATLKYEGTWADHPKDPGGATMKGITLATYRRYKPGATKAQLRAISQAEVETIYRAGYWNPVRGDDLPPGLDLSVFDAGVMSGPSRSVKWLQAALGVSADGVVGDKETMPALRKADVPKAIKAHCAKRLGFVKSLAIWNTFGKGWSKRIASVEATALSWVLTKPELEQEAKDAKDKASQQAGGAVVVTGAGTADQASGGLSGLPWWGVAIIVVLIAAPLIIRFIVNTQRARALASKAQEA